MARRALILVAALLVLLLVVVPAWVAYSSLHPSRCSSELTPEDMDMDYMPFTAVTKDDILIDAWLIPGSGDPETVFVLMHGYTSCKADERLLTLAREIHDRGYTVAMFDFRGHGDSEGVTTIGPRELLDLDAVLGFLEKSGYERIILVGYSMGGAVAIVGGYTDPRVDVIVADSPYYSLDQVIPRWIGSQTPLPAAYGKLIGFYGEIIAGVDTSFGPAHVDRVNKPLLVLYGTEDPLITLDEAEEIAEKSPCGRLVVAQGAGHVEIHEQLGLDKYVDEIEDIAWEECPE